MILLLNSGNQPITIQGTNFGTNSTVASLVMHDNNHDYFQFIWLFQTKKLMLISLNIFIK